MAQLWGGRFTKETNELVNNFNASISFDQKFYRQDIRGSIAHVTMLAASGILTDDERDQIIAGLNGILSDVENGSLEITPEYEDIHSFVEANLIDRLGDTGKKLHTGRSRNDQVALDMRLYTRKQVAETDELLKEKEEISYKGDLREQDVLLAVGEQITATKLAMCLKFLGHDAISLLGWQVPILTDSNYGEANIIKVKTG